MIISQSPLCVNGYSHHLQHRSDFQSAFRDLVLADANAHGFLLDVGCGNAVNPTLAPIYEIAREVHGVDTCPGVLSHNGLDRRWHSAFENAPIPDSAYDMAIAYNVLEHVRTASPFLRRVHQVLRPGGSFWALTPNAYHPFAYLSRSLEVLGLKPWFARHNSAVNDYPAYYRLNSQAAIARPAAAIGFREARFYFVPCMQWDRYFPSALRWLPHMYDRAVGLRISAAMSVLITVLRK